VSSDVRRNITGLTSLSLGLLVVSCAAVFCVKPSALGATNARPRRVLSSINVSGFVYLGISKHRRTAEGACEKSKKQSLTLLPYFPSISLTGLFGTASSDLSKLFTGPGRVWSVAGPITASIFTVGAIAGQVETAEGVQQETLFRYQQIIQTAFQEANDGLVHQERTKEQLAARRVEALREYVRLAWLRFDEGYSSYLEVTYLQNLALQRRTELTVVQSNLLQAFANLYKAMGIGG
jgi:Outer membrane efflux protein